MRAACLCSWRRQISANSGTRALPSLSILPSESALKQSGLDAIDEAGVVYNLLADRWQTSKDMDVNYMIAAARPL